MLRKILRRSLKVCLGFAVLWFLVHLVENWRGKHAWESWKAEQVAKGAHYQVEDLVPPPLPDADNFAKAAVVESGIKGKGDFLGGFKFSGPGSFPPGWRTGQAMDLKAWADANKTDDLEASLAPAAGVLDHLAEAAKRSGCRFDVPRNDENYPGIKILGFRHVGRLLTIRSLLHLRSGQTNAAMQDVITQLRIIRHLSSEPDLTVELTQLAMCGFVMQAVWEGLETHAWNEPQLVALQDELSRMDELTPFLVMGQSQRISAANFYGMVTSEKWWSRDSSKSGRSGGLLAHCLIPRGWMYQNWRKADEHFAATWLMAVDTSKHRIYPDRVREIESWWVDKRVTPYTVFAKLLSVAGPGMTSQAHRFAERQVTLDEAFLVCGLERYRLAHKNYPDNLQALVPRDAASLPNDVLTGLPLRYKRTDKGGFLLYSVGWNGNDENGSMGMEGKERDLTKGDWPWPHLDAIQPGAGK